MNPSDPFPRSFLVKIERKYQSNRKALLYHGWPLQRQCCCRAFLTSMAQYCKLIGTFCSVL